MKTLYIKIAVSILRASLPSLRKKADETKSEVDNMILDIVDAIIKLYDSGELKI